LETAVATNVIMPQASDSMEQGTVLRWLKQEGDFVKKGDVLAEIETDKAVLDLEAFGEGQIRCIIVQEGESAPVRSVLAVIAHEGETVDLPSLTKLDEADSKLPVAGPPRSTKPIQAKRRGTATPAAKHLAKLHNLDLSGIRGTGKGGTIEKQDVLAHLESAGKSTPEGLLRVTLPPIRIVMGKRLQESVRTAPHFYVSLDVDMTRCLELRTAFNQSLEITVSINDVLVKACAVALQRMPIVNSVWAGETVIQSAQVNVGMAVDVENGIVVPVLEDAGTRKLTAIAKESRRLIASANSGKLTSQTRATFTISNLGMFGVKAFTAIINPPECAILAVGSIEKRPVIADDDRVVARQIVTITLSADHRIIDGATAAAFLNAVRDLLEKPEVIFSR